MTSEFASHFYLLLFKINFAMKKNNQSYKSNKNSKTKYISIFCISLILISAIGYGVYYYISNFKNNTNNTSSTMGDSSHKYVRSPFGAKFKINDSSKTFVLTSSHFDSPGANSSINSLNETETKSNISSQGSQEVLEAQNIPIVLNTFKKSFNSNNILFYGDTNIKKGNEAKAFSTLDKSGYSMLFKDNETYSTSLSSTLNSFANPYDKIIYSFNDGLSIVDNHDDIKNVIKQGYDHNTGFAINTFLTLPSTTTDNSAGQGWIKYPKNFKVDKSNTDPIYYYLKYLVSDHIPVGTEISYVDNNNSTQYIRVGGWNTLNFSLYDKDFSSFDIDSVTGSLTNDQKKQIHEINIGDIIYHAKYDLIALIEINKGTSQSQVTTFLNYLNKLSSDDSNISYSGLLSSNTPAIKNDSGQIEQVLFIYNNKKLTLDKDINAAFFNDYSALSTTISSLLINSLNIYKE